MTGKSTTTRSALSRLRGWLVACGLRAPPILRTQVVRLLAVRGYKRRFGRLPNLRQPRRFSEYVIHRVIYDRDPALKLLADKLAVRRIITQAAGPDYVVPVLGSWDSARAIPWPDLPLPAVLKPTHLSGPFAFLHDPGSIDRVALEREADAWLRTDHFYRHGEWGYLGCPRRLVAEPLLRAPDGGALIETAVFTFHGEPVLIKALHGLKGSEGRCCLWQDSAGRTPDLHDITPLACDRLPTEAFRRLKEQVDAARAEMLEVSARIGALMPLVRVDFYLTGQGLRIGELTPYPLAGTTPYEPSEWDDRLGRMLRDGGLKRRDQGFEPYAWPPLS